MFVKAFSQQFIIVGPQNACGQGVNKNIHTDSKYLNIDGYAKLKITTQQHRTFDRSKIFDAVSNELLWEWRGESYNATWYFKEHFIEVNTTRIRVEFTQGYKDPFCNGFIKVEKTTQNNYITKSNFGGTEQTKTPNENAIITIKNQEPQVSSKEQNPTNSSLDGASIHPSAIEYYGQIVNHKAHGYGEVSWKNGTKTAGLFEANSIVNGVMKTTFQNGEICFGPNSGHNNNGPCIQVLPNGDVRFSSYVNGKWSGFTHEHWEIKKNQPIQLKIISKIESSQGRIEEITKIPKTGLLLILRSKEFNSQGFKKHWFEVLDANLNIIVNRIGSFESPISIHSEPVLELIDENNLMYFSIGHGDKKGHVIVNPFNSKITNITEVTLNLKKDNISKGKLLTETTKSSRQGLLYVNEFLEKKLIYPSGTIISYKNSTEGVTIIMSKGTVQKYQHFIKDKFAWDIILNEKNNKIVLSLGNSDVTSSNQNSSLCYVDSLEIREFDQRVGASAQGTLTYSKNFTYLIFTKNKSNAGSRIYYGVDLFYAVPGELLFINEYENIACVKNNNTISFFDIQKRVIISNFKKNIKSIDLYDFEELNGNFNIAFRVSDTVFSASLKIPNPPISFSSFSLKPFEEIVSKSSTKVDNSKTNTGSSTNSNVNTTEGLTNMTEALTKMLEYQSIYSKMTGKEPGVQTCKWCGRKFAWGKENSGFDYRKRSPSYQCEVLGSVTGDYCSKDCALKGCLANDR
jgi:hypothetical protein